MAKRYFRADKRLFDVGDEITTAGDFSDRHNEIGKFMEMLLERTRPQRSKPGRRECLFVYENESDAKSHWWQLTGGNLYEVKIDESAIRHRGDMNLTEEIGKNVADEKLALELANKYWRGEVSEKPCIEVLVGNAAVVTVLGRDAERRAYLRSKIRPTSTEAQESIEEFLSNSDRD